MTRAPDSAADDRTRAVRRVLLITLVLNLAVAFAKVAAGRWFHVLSLTADGLHSTLDGLNNVVGLIAVGLARRPPDEGHPYGHAKFETFAALGVGVSLGILGAGLVREAITRVQASTPSVFHPVLIAVAVATLAINLGVARYETLRGRALRSDFLLADAQHTAGDVLVTLAVLAALGAVWLRRPVVDLAIAFGLAGFIAYNAWRIIARNLNVLADAAAIDPARVIAVARAIDGVRACHRIRSRGPAGQVHLDLHVQVDPAMATADSHALGHRVAAALRAALPDVVDVLVHVEPHAG